MNITITEAINLLKQYYKTHNREDVEIEGEIRVTGGGVILDTKPQPEKPNPFDTLGVWERDTMGRGTVVEDRVPVERDGSTKKRNAPTGEFIKDDPKLGRDKSGDGK